MDKKSEFNLNSESKYQKYVARTRNPNPWRLYDGFQILGPLFQ